jgi:tRNA A-37 threonylcarbamoyl transferase component Bud32
VSDDLDPLVKAALAEPRRRVRLLVLPDGRRFWLKRVERLQGVLRLQKGDPQRAFRAERDGLETLAKAGLPVAAIAQQGPGWMLMPDAGPVLPAVVADPQRPDAEKLQAFAQAGKALGLLHWAGMVHGRPAVRDICWDGQVARFIDLERFRHDRRGGFWQAMDVLMLTQTAFTLWPDDLRWLEAALASYDVNAPLGAMERVRRLAWWLAPIGWVARAMMRVRPGNRELRAVGLTLNRLRQAWPISSKT